MHMLARLIPPSIIYMNRHAFDLEEMNRNVQKALDTQPVFTAELSWVHHPVRLIVENARNTEPLFAGDDVCQIVGVLLHLDRLAVHFFCSGRRLFCTGGVVLYDFVHFGDGLADLLDSLGLFL